MQLIESPYKTKYIFTNAEFVNYFVAFSLDYCPFTGFVVYLIFHILILVPPKISPFSFGDEPMNYGDSAYILCSIFSGDLPVEIDWFVNGKSIHELKFSDKIRITNVGKKAKALSIDSVNENFIANYSCKASNLADSVFYSSELLVNGICKIDYDK